MWESSSPKSLKLVTFGFFKPLEAQCYGMQKQKLLGVQQLHGARTVHHCVAVEYPELTKCLTLKSRHCDYLIQIFSWVLF